MPPQPVERYQIEQKTADFMIWTFQQQRTRLSEGKKLRLDLWSRARVRWTASDWETFEDSQTVDTGIGVHYAMLPIASLKRGRRVIFTTFWVDTGKWEGRNFEVNVI